MTAAHTTAPAVGAGATIPCEQLIAVRLDALRDAPWQARGIESEAALEALADSIGDAGVLEPVLVRSHPDGQGYQLLAGHRRRDAVRLLARRAAEARPTLPDQLRDPVDGAAMVPARLLDVDDVGARRITFAENAHRADLCAWDRAQAVAAYRDVLADAATASIPEQKHVAERLRLAETTVSECLKIATTLTVDVQNEASAAWGLSHAHPDVRHALRRLSHLALCRAARQPDPATRASVLRAALDRVRLSRNPPVVAPATPAGFRRNARPSSAPLPGSLESVQARRDRYQRLRSGAAFDYRRNNGLVAYDAPAARAQLDELAPALGILAERVGNDGSPVLLDTGSGGTVLVLPTTPAAMSPEAMASALALLVDLRQMLEASCSEGPETTSGSSAGSASSGREVRAADSPAEGTLAERAVSGAARPDASDTSSETAKVDEVRAAQLMPATPTSSGVIRRRPRQRPPLYPHPFDPADQWLEATIRLNEERERQELERQRRLDDDSPS